MAVDGGFVDARFEPGGQFSDFQFTPTAAVTEVERRVRDRFWALAGAKGNHCGDHRVPLRQRLQYRILADRDSHRMCA